MRFPNVGLGDRGELNSDINVTPLVSVLLVILVYLMIALPADDYSFGRRSLLYPWLPLAVHAIEKPDPRTHALTVVAVDANRYLYVDYLRVHEDEVAARVKDSLKTKTEKTVLFIGDHDAPYSTVMAAMDQLRAAEIRNVTLVVEQREIHPGRAGAVR